MSPPAHLFPSNHAKSAPQTSCKVRDTTTPNPRPDPMLNPPDARSRIRLTMFRGPYASPRLLLPRLQEKLLQDADACPIRGRQNHVPALRQPQSRTASIALLRRHLPEEPEFRTRKRYPALSKRRFP